MSSRGRVLIEDYDPRWAELFDAEKQLLSDALGSLVETIEHVGSTAVEGLAAKPIIDILITVPSLNLAPRIIPLLSGLGYEYIDKYEIEFPFRRYFRKIQAGHHTHHIHLVPQDHLFAIRHRVFRDYLREFELVRREYHQLKIELAAKYRDDRDSYQQGKDQFIRMVEKEAIRYYSQDLPESQLGE